MIWKYIALILISAAALLLPSCGHEQQLTLIQIQPSTETFGASNIPVIANAGSNVQLKALGTYIHPPVTKDITNSVVWSSNTPGMVMVNTTGLITATGQACGGTLISATVTTNHSIGNIGSTGAIVTGFMTANVVCFTSSGSGGPVLTVNFPGPGSGRPPAAAGRGDAVPAAHPVASPAASTAASHGPDSRRMPLQAGDFLARVRVPQLHYFAFAQILQAVIRRPHGGQDLAVGGEGGGSKQGMPLGNPRAAQLLAAGHIPLADDVIHARSNESCAISRECNGRHLSVVHGKSSQFLSRGGIPEPDGTVARG